MSLIQDVKNDIREAKKIRLPWWGVLCWMAACGLIDWMLIVIGRFDDLALPTTNCIAVLGFLIVLKRRLKRYAWFWTIIFIIAALHVPLILLIPWTTEWVPALAIAVIDSADLIMILAILSVAGKLMGGTKTVEG
jgi:hypothetical protein